MAICCTLHGTVVPNKDLAIKNEPAKMVINQCLYMLWECKKCKPKSSSRAFWGTFGLAVLP